MSDPASSPPSLPRVPAARGWHWWLDAFGLLREQPLTLLLFGLVYCLIVLGFNVLPGVGNVLAVLCENPQHGQPTVRIFAQQTPTCWPGSVGGA